MPYFPRMVSIMKLSVFQIWSLASAEYIKMSPGIDFCNCIDDHHLNEVLLKVSNKLRNFSTQTKNRQRTKKGFNKGNYYVDRSERRKRGYSYGQYETDVDRSERRKRGYSYGQYNVDRLERKNRGYSYGKYEITKRSPDLAYEYSIYSNGRKRTSTKAWICY